MAKLEMFVNGNFADGEEVYQIGTKNAEGTGETNDGQYYDPMRKSEAEAKLKELSKDADKSSEKKEEKKAAKKDTETKPAARKRKAPAKSRS